MDTPTTGPTPPTYDDETVLNGAARCTAKAKRSGDRCRKPAIRGARVCRTHGGAAPQVRQSARLRLAALADPAIGVLAEVIDSRLAEDRDRIRAAEAILDRAGYPRRTEVDLTDARERLRDRIAAELEESDA